MFSSKTISIAIILLLFVNLKSQGLQINEVMLKNYNSIVSFEGKNEDWIEIYNNSNDTIQLNNYFLSDKYEDLQKWRFPLAQILPHQYIIVFASGKESNTNIELHSNFKLKKSESLYLSDLTNIAIDKIENIDIDADVTFGRISENNSETNILDIPSPYSSNINSNHLSFSHESGFYEDEFYLEVENLKSGHTIFYTFDGSTPTNASDTFINPLLIEDRSFLENDISMIRTSPVEDIYYHNWIAPKTNLDKINSLKFISYYNNTPSSIVYSKSYLINQENHQLFTTCIAIDSIDLFGKFNGIYVPGDYNQKYPNGTGNYFKDISVLGTATIFDLDRKLIINQDCDFKIQGRGTRPTAQKSLKLYAKKEYSTKYFNANLIKDDKNSQYKRFSLRTTQGSVERNFFGDELSVEIIKNLDVDFSNYQFTNVFINGEYWGVQSIRNKMDSRYFSNLLNIDEEDINIVDADFTTIIKGDNSSLLAIKSFIENNDLSLDKNLEKVEKEIDLKSFIDYQIAEMFFNNFDWPGNNSKLWKPNTPNGKWRYIFYDMDDTFREEERNMFEHTTANNSDSWRNSPEYTFLFRNLLKNEQFKANFIKRYDYLLNNDLSYNSTLISFNKLVRIVNPTMQNNIDRWQYPASEKRKWLESLDQGMVSFLLNRPCIVKNQLNDFFSLGNKNIKCKIKVERNINFKIFPNPNNGFFSVSIESNNASTLLDLNIITVTGKSIFRDYVILSENNTFDIDISSTPNGIFFIELISNEKFYGIQKFIIAK